jgi:uncharacterized surface protein with fasciclin (FAS1) repeats
MIRIKILATAATAALLAAPAAFAQTPPAPTTPAPTAPAPAACPNASDNVIEVLRTRGQYSALLAALDQAQLTETLATRPRITLFAPTDAAFAALPEAERTRLMDPANVQELRDLMLYHTLVADLRPDQIIGARGPIATAGGLEVTIDGTGDAIKVDSATVIQAGIDAANGNVYPIDKLLDPTAAAAAPASPAPAPTAATGVNAPDGRPAATVTTTASPPVRNPTDGQVDQTEDAGNPAPTPN